MFYRIISEGAIAQLRVTPGASREQLGGLVAGADGFLSLQLKVRAQPEKGKANAAVIQFMAKAMDVPKSRVEIISGETDRRKSLLIRGEARELTEKLEALYKEGAGDGRGSD